MRARFLLVSILFLPAACAGPRVTHSRYSPPSAAPVRAAVASAQDHARQVKTDIAEARKAGDKEQLELALTDADGAVDQLTVELVSAQTALLDYEAKSQMQTDALNLAVDDKNLALLERDRASEKASIASKKLWRTRGLLLAAVIWIFRTPLLALGKMVIGLVAKI
jgi:hypothetical protein